MDRAAIESATDESSGRKRTVPSTATISQPVRATATACPTVGVTTTPLVQSFHSPMRGRSTAGRMAARSAIPWARIPAAPPIAQACAT
ncbi:hypothetical protein JOF29_007302 [Kribbella aluminosa]|uniref:Uncharacterized protein n=1 Tax=Kribbella aluminosa TaxID=416017 RepID=A0ABS4UX39_9ACTN|nr:hypothetical protein [Kribbella aluminosa]